MNSPHVLNIGVAFCTPIPFVNGPNGPRLAMVTTEWHRKFNNLVMPTNFNKVNVQTDGMEVGDARNKAAQLVLEAKPRPKYLFFLDYDVLPAHDAVQKLLYRAQTNPDHDIFAGVYCSKVELSEPLIYKSWGEGPYWDWTIGDILSEGVVGVHMGCTLIRTSLFERLSHSDEKPWFLTQNRAEFNSTGLQFIHGTEDLHFCKRAVEEIGAKIMVDTSVLCGHIDNSTGRIYGLPSDSPPVKRAFWVQNGWDKTPEGEEPTLRAIDLGAGEHRRSWPGYKTFGTDIREGLGPDVLVQDTLALNLPDESFDLVASSHHLEHIPRTEQERVWREMYRICKRGGKIEHTVPSIEWASHNIYDGHVDEHVYNVLYGAQETHGYERDLNTHYFGYTKAVAKALAEGAGFVDVTCEDWRDREELGYNLIIRGTKPLAPFYPLEDVPEDDGIEVKIPCSDLDMIEVSEDNPVELNADGTLADEQVDTRVCRVAYFKEPTGEVVSRIVNSKGQILVDGGKPVKNLSCPSSSWSYADPDDFGLVPFDKKFTDTVCRTEGAC